MLNKNNSALWHNEIRVVRSEVVSGFASHLIGEWEVQRRYGVLNMFHKVSGHMTEEAAQKAMARLQRKIK